MRRFLFHFMVLFYHRVVKIDGRFAEFVGGKPISKSIRMFYCHTVNSIHMTNYVSRVHIMLNSPTLIIFTVLLKLYDSKINVQL